MKSHEAMGRMIGRDADVIADALSVSTILVRKSKADPMTGSGTRNDIDRLEIQMRTALELGRMPVDALAPIRYLCQVFDPCQRGCSAEGVTIRDVEKAHSRLLRDVAALLVPT